MQSWKPSTLVAANRSEAIDMGRLARVCLAIVGGAVGLGLAYTLHHVAGEVGLMAGLLLMLIAGFFNERRKRNTRQNPKNDDDPLKDSA